VQFVIVVTREDAVVVGISGVVVIEVVDLISHICLNDCACHTSHRVYGAVHV